MGKKMLRSVLVAAFSAAMAFGALSGLSGAKGDIHTRADSTWPSAVKSATIAEDSTWPAPPIGVEDSTWPTPPIGGGDSTWPAPSTGADDGAGG